MIKPISVTASSNYRIHIAFSDGVEGEVDLSALAGQGVSEAWKEQGFFERVHLGIGRQIRWSDEIELCPDAVYMRLTGKTPKELFPRLKHGNLHA